MPNEEPWFDFHAAVQEMQQRLVMSRGGAQAELRQLCASGQVRSRKQPYTIVNCEPQPEGPEERIEPSEWRSREIDLMTDTDGCSYFVDVSKEDFRHWLAQQETKSQGGKQSRITAALAKHFSGSPVPDRGQCPRQALKADLLKLDPTLKPLDLKTLKTAIDAYNLSRKRP
jgi:hypothetical protein